MPLPRHTFSYNSEKPIKLEQFLNWCRKFDTAVILNSNNDQQFQEDQYGIYDLLIAAGKIDEMPAGLNFFDSLKKFQMTCNDWLFGYISYDVKNQVEKLKSENNDGIQADEFIFFRPRYVIEITGGNIQINYLPEFDNENSVKEIINEIENITENKTTVSNLEIKSRINREEYIDTIKNIKKHIQRGDIYEINYCMEFFSENAVIDPENVYCMLNDESPMPFSAFFRNYNISLMCASPERYLAKRGNKIISQPIKGTAKRGSNQLEDEKIIESLRNDKKEQAENVMIVDMVRNDLSKTASKGTVIAEELFGIKTFKQLHQMVSTITSMQKENVHFTEVIKSSFPMGSMTGAPKVRAMELIEEFEKSKRGIFSGSIGYVKPSGDFDLNVIIRSVIYNAENHYLSFMAGSAITAAADPAKEYEECLLKAASMKKVLGN